MSVGSDTAGNPEPTVMEKQDSGTGLILAVLSLCGIGVALMQTLIVPLVPSLPSILHTSGSNASWAITSTLLAGAVVTPISGRLGDMFGKRRMLLASLVSMAIGSVVCALADSLIPMVIGRTLQGFAAGAIALGISILRDELPAEKVGSAVAVMSATMGVGGAVGIPVAATIAQKANWHTLFWVSAVIAVIGFVAVLVVVPESPVKTPGRFDIVGAGGLAVGLVSLLLALTKGAEWGWGSGRVLGCLALAVVVLLAWGFFELRVAAPLVDLRVSARPQVLFTNLASVATGFAMYGMSLIPMQILMAPSQVGYGLGLSMIQAGLVLAPSGFVMFLFSPLGAKISKAKGPRISLAVGVVVVALGYVSALFLRNNPLEIAFAMSVIGAGIGIAYAAMPALIMGAVPITETAAANGLNSLMRAVGTSLSSAGISMILTSQTMTFGPVEMPTDGAFTTAFVVSIAACAVALVFALAVPKQRV